MKFQQLLLVAALLVALGPVSAYYLPGTYPQEFAKGSKIEVEANSLVSSETEIPYRYYRMPFCKPVGGVKKASSTVNPGTILLGIRINNSPYSFSVMEETKTKVVCQGEDYPGGAYTALTSKEVKTLKEKIRDQYRVRLILDNLPITTYDLELDPESVRPGYEVGYKLKDKYYVNNHLMFKVLVHESDGRYSRVAGDASLEAAAASDLAGRKMLAGETPGGAAEKLYMIVGFEVVACSIAREPGKPLANVPCAQSYEDPSAPKAQEVKEGARIVYTYDVYWDTSDITWASRWDAYLRMPGGRVHWFSILNSLMVVVVMSCIVALITLRTIRRDLAHYEALLVDGGAAGPGAPPPEAEESGWKMVGGDVFRAPPDTLSLAVQVGSGVQILASAGVTLLFASLGFLSPAARGSLLTAALAMYLLLSVAAGAAAVWLWGVANRTYEGWHKVCWRVACFFPGVTVAVLTVLNMFLWYTGSAGTIPLGFFFSIIFLWLLVSIPLAYGGGALAARRDIAPWPSRTNQIPRHIPAPHWASHPLVLFVAAGLLPFGTIFVELYFAMTSLWQGYFYYIFGFLALVAALTLIITIEVSIVCTYVQLCAEDYLWWWRSYHRGGSVAAYVAIYSVGFLFNTLHNLSGFVPVVLYLAYTGLMAWCMFLASGTIGFLSSYLFTYKIFESVKAD
ncbi:EMP70 [Auxenochlorella protothecoides x Auxenochlorella symbiontica]